VRIKDGGAPSLKLFNELMRGWSGFIWTGTEDAPEKKTKPVRAPKTKKKEKKDKNNVDLTRHVVALQVVYNVVDNAIVVVVNVH